MICEAIKLGGAQLTIYARDNTPEISARRKYPTVLVIPGGGYGFCSAREGEPVALAFLAAGCTAAVLRYSAAPARHPTQLFEAAAAMAYLREHAKKYHIDPKRVFACGFSAGGHLAGMLGTLWKETSQGARAKPTATILCYPVISSGACAHAGSFVNLTGGDKALGMRLSLELRVDTDTAPAFLWATADDAAVPAMNALLYAGALAKQGIPYALHVFPSGVHGLSLATELTGPVNVEAQAWFGLAMEWVGSHCARG